MPNEQLYQHQKEAVDFIRSKDRGILAYGMGTGKTLSVLEAYRPYKEQGCKLLVICPLTLIREAWEKDNARFTQYRFCNLRLKDRTEADVYAINFEAMLSEKRRMEIAQLCNKFKVICVIDESSRISNPQAKTTKHIIAMRNQFVFSLALSGTPNSQSDLQWWSQLQLVKPGLLPDSFFQFRNTYFHLQRGCEIMRPGPIPKDIARTLFSKGWKYQITPARRAALMQKISPHVRWKRLEDCFDMPPEVDQVRPVIMTDEQEIAYKQMKQECLTEIMEKEIPATTALTKLMKLRTITSGFAYTPDGETARFKVNPKLDELMEVLDELGDEKVVVFCNFRAEIEDIKRLLGDRCVTVDAETEDKSEAIEAFCSGKVQHLIANEASISHGVTLIQARYMIFYSHSYSAEKFVQARARIRRIGQTGACVYIHLVATKTIDEIVLDVLRRKQDLVEVVRRMMTDG